MDRGVPTEMRAADPPVHYLVGTPKGRLTRLEKHLIAPPSSLLSSAGDKRWKRSTSGSGL